jgi:putative acetyltransferase
MTIQEAKDSDAGNVWQVHREAFGYDKEADLVKALLGDPTARPLYSFLSIHSGRAIGHVLFTSARLEGATTDVSLSILAPLAVIPGFQKQGVGGALIGHGLRCLADAGVELVFVLGHPDYYPRHGFMPAGARGFEAPYLIPRKHADAWMVQELRPGVIGTVSGRVRCAEMLNKPEHWRE